MIKIIFVYNFRNFFKKIKTHYEVLEIELTANQRDIKHAFLKLSKKVNLSTSLSITLDVNLLFYANSVLYKLQSFIY